MDTQKQIRSSQSGESHVLPSIQARDVSILSDTTRFKSKTPPPFSEQRENDENQADNIPSGHGSVFHSSHSLPLPRSYIASETPDDKDVFRSHSIPQTPAITRCTTATWLADPTDYLKQQQQQQQQTVHSHNSNATNSKKYNVNETSYAPVEMNLPFLPQNRNSYQTFGTSPTTTTTNLNRSMPMVVTTLPSRTTEKPESSIETDDTDSNSERTTVWTMHTYTPPPQRETKKDTLPSKEKRPPVAPTRTASGTSSTVSTTAAAHFSETKNPSRHKKKSSHKRASQHARKHNDIDQKKHKGEESSSTCGSRPRPQPSKPRREPILEDIQYQPNEEPPHPGNPIDALPYEKLFEWYATYVRYLFRVVNATATLHHYADKYFRRRHRRLGFAVGLINGFGSISTLMSSSDVRRVTLSKVDGDSELSSEVMSFIALGTGILLLLNVVLSTLQSYVDYKTQASFHYDLYKRLIELRDTIIHMDIDPYADPIENAKLLEQTYHKLMVQAPYMNTTVMREVVKKWRVADSSEDINFYNRSRILRFLRYICCCGNRCHSSVASNGGESRRRRNDDILYNQMRQSQSSSQQSTRHANKVINRIDASRISLLDQQVVVEWIAERMRLYNVRHPSLLQYALAYKRYWKRNQQSQRPPSPIPSNSYSESHASGSTSDEQPDHDEKKQTRTSSTNHRWPSPKQTTTNSIRKSLSLLHESSSSSSSRSRTSFDTQNNSPIKATLTYSNHDQPQNIPAHTMINDHAHRTNIDSKMQSSQPSFVSARSMEPSLNDESAALAKQSFNDDRKMNSSTALYPHVTSASDVYAPRTHHQQQRIQSRPKTKSFLLNNRMERVPRSWQSNAVTISPRISTVTPFTSSQCVPNRFPGQRSRTEDPRDRLESIDVMRRSRR